MRWIKERAEALLHQRRFDVNGDWDAFARCVHDHRHDAALATKM